MVYGTHETIIARQVSDAVRFMDQGELLEVAPPEKFFARSTASTRRQILA